MTTITKTFEIQPEPGILVRRVEDGVMLVLYAMLFGNTRLCIGSADAASYDRGWCYQADHLQGAMTDAMAWDGESGDPPGPWYKSLQTGETRAEFGR